MTDPIHDEVVRDYARALLVVERQRRKERRKENKEEEPETDSLSARLGDDPDAVAKAYRQTDEYREKMGRKKKKKKVKTSYRVTDPILLDSMHNEPPPDAAKLASLRAKADEAIRLASEQAGKQLYWCCGKLRPAGEVGQDGCSCRDVWRYQEINGWEHD